MHRDITRKLEAWKLSDDRKPLILKGARQVGKTYTLKEFGARNYKNTVYVNCDNDATAQNILSRDYSVERILLELAAYTGQQITPHETLIILDEIQEAPKGLHALKYFCEQAPEYHVAVAGSLLGITLHGGESFPVGKVDIIEMFPMSFLEFLRAKGHGSYADIIESQQWEAVNDLLPSLTTLMRQYYFVGGMPEIVKCFVDEGNATRVREKQLTLLASYQADISKHAPVKDVPRINQVWQSIPAQLAKENKKFIFRVIRQGARAADFELAIQWLVDAGLVYKVNRVTAARLPLNFYTDWQAFKLYMLDCGLLGAMSGAPAEMMLVTDNVFVEFKGSFTEQYAAQQLKAAGISPLCYFSNEKSTQEIDFVFQDGINVVPLEVKAEVNTKAKSFKQFLADNPTLHGLRASMLPYRREERFDNLPLPAIGVAKAPNHLNPHT